MSVEALKRVDNGVTFESVARLVCSRVGWPWDNLTQRQWELVRTEVGAALRVAWEAFWWSDLMQTERVTLRPDYATGTYAAAAEVYHLDSDDYYTALQASTSQAPATLVGTVWVTNYAYWARLSEPESVDEGDWESGRIYAAGKRVVWHRSVYVCIQAHTASGAILPSNVLYWGVLAPFDYTVPYAQTGRTVIGRVRQVTAEDPRVNPEARRFEFSPTADGIAFANLDVTRPWVTYRVRCPELDGEAFDSGTVYTAEAAGRAVWGL